MQNIIDGWYEIHDMNIMKQTGLTLFQPFFFLIALIGWVGRGGAVKAAIRDFVFHSQRA